MLTVRIIGKILISKAFHAQLLIISMTTIRILFANLKAKKASGKLLSVVIL